MKCPAAVIRRVTGRPSARSNVAMYHAGVDGSFHETVTASLVSRSTWAFLKFFPQGAVGCGRRTLEDRLHGAPRASRSHRRSPITIPAPPVSITYEKLSGRTSFQIVWIALSVD